MLEQIAKNIRERKLFRDGECILVAVSGGVDSMVLLHALHQLSRDHKWKLTVAHFNHQLRGKESDADEKFVRQVAREKRLPALIDGADVKLHAANSGQSIEMAARELRHKFLARAASKLKIKTVVLAHQADDQVELFFLRLLRGASVEGLAGMRWRSPSLADKRIQLLRPLLNISRQDLETFAREHKIDWREDTSNLSMDFLRNRVRRELIPLLQKDYQPGLRHNILRLTEIMRAESDVVAHATNEALSTKQSFDRRPIAIQRRMLQQQLFQLNLPADFSTIEFLRLHVDKVFEVSPTTRIARDERGRIRLIAKPKAEFSQASRKVKLTSTTAVAKFGNTQLTFHITKQHGAKFDGARNTESFDAGKVGRVVILRHWRPGDRFQPIGSNSSRKLQDTFVDLKISKEQRHSRVVATTVNGEIFWVEGLRIAENFKLTDATTRRLVLRWEHA